MSNSPDKTSRSYANSRDQVATVGAELKSPGRKRKSGAGDITFPRLGYSLAELEMLVGLSRSTPHRIVARGELETTKRGRRRLVPAHQVERLCRMSESDHRSEAARARASGRGIRVPKLFR